MSKDIGEALNKLKKLLPVEDLIIFVDEARCLGIHTQKDFDSVSIRIKDKDKHDHVITFSVEVMMQLIAQIVYSIGESGIRAKKDFKTP